MKLVRPGLREALAAICSRPKPDSVPKLYGEPAGNGGSSTHAGMMQLQQVLGERWKTGGEGQKKIYAVRHHDGSLCTQQQPALKAPIKKRGVYGGSALGSLTQHEDAGQQPEEGGSDAQAPGPGGPGDVRPPNGQVAVVVDGTGHIVGHQDTKHAKPASAYRIRI